MSYDEVNRTIRVDKYLVPRKKSSMIWEELLFEMKDYYGNVVEHTIKFEVTIPQNTSPFFR